MVITVVEYFTDEDDYTHFIGWSRHTMMSGYYGMWDKHYVGDLYNTKTDRERFFSVEKVYKDPRATITALLNSAGYDRVIFSVV